MYVFSISFLFLCIKIYNTEFKTIYFGITCSPDAEFDDDNERGRKGNTKLRSCKCKKTSTYDMLPSEKIFLVTSFSCIFPPNR